MKHLTVVLFAVALLAWCKVGRCERPNYGDGTWDCDKVANITYEAALQHEEQAANPDLLLPNLRSKYANDPEATAIVIDAFNSEWRGLSPTGLAQANYQECKSAVVRSQPGNTQSDPDLQGAELRWQLLHGLGKMIPPFLLGVLLIGGLWLVTVLWRKGRKRREDS